MILAAIISLEMLKASQCEVACGYMGYDKGFYLTKEDACLCGDVKPYDESIHKKKVILPKKAVKESKPSSSEWYPHW